MDIHQQRQVDLAHAFGQRCRLAFPAAPWESCERFIRETWALLGYGMPWHEARAHVRAGWSAALMGDEA